MPPLISDRDFCWWSVDHNLADGTYVTAAKSLVTAECGPESYHVRGEIRASGYVVEPHGVKDQPAGSHSKVTYVVQTNPGGWLPAWVVNIVAASQAYNPGVIKEKAPIFLEQLKKQDAARKQEEEWKAKAEAERKKRAETAAAAGGDAKAASADAKPAGGDSAPAPSAAADGGAAPTAAASDAAPASSAPVAASS